MSERRIPWGRLAAEFVVIVIGVLVALGADAWWSQQGDRDEERAGLQLILADLEADTALIQEFIGYARGHDRAAATFLRYGDDPPGMDSVATTLRSFLFGNLPGLRQAGFLSLREGGRLSLIQDPELRFRIMSYYSEDQPETQRWLEEHWERYNVFIDYWGRHLRAPRPRSTDSSWPLTGPVVVVSPWSAIRADLEFDAQALKVGAAAAIAILVAEGLLESNRELQGAIREELGWAPENPSPR